MNFHQILRSFRELLLCIGVAYIFMRGLLGVFYEVASWVVKKLDGPDNEKDSETGF